MTPTVSVIIATHNYGRFLAKAIDSVLRQTYTDFEVIVVDDGSTDDTPAVVRPFLQDGRLRYHRTEHCGQPAAKNTGLMQTHGPLIAFLDADDVWLPTKLERQVACFLKDTDIGLVYTRRILMSEQERELEYVQPELHRGEVLPQLFGRNFVCFSSSMVHRSVIWDVGGFDESLPLAIDYELWLRVACKYRFDYVDEPLVRYRVGHVSLGQRSLERARLVRGIMQRFLDERGGRELLDPQMVSRVLAEQHCDIGFAQEDQSWSDAARDYLTALKHCPTHRRAWQRLAVCWWPRPALQLARRVLNRPDWRASREKSVA
jgi:glycosyltransferase involved in cell wall biosynthesis